MEHSIWAVSHGVSLSFRTQCLEMKLDLAEQYFLHNLGQLDEAAVWSSEAVGAQASRRFRRV
jgi:hypothetical protein